MYLREKHGDFCDVVVFGDQTVCKTCGLTWDTNDPDPPKCLKYSVMKPRLV